MPHTTKEEEKSIPVDFSQEIAEVRELIAGSPISLRKNLNPECLKAGHFCGWSIDRKMGGEVCISKSDNPEWKVEAGLCSKNPNKGKKIIVDEKVIEKKMEIEINYE